MWILQNSNDLYSTYNLGPFPPAIALKYFTSLPSMPHSKLKDKLREFVQLYFIKKNGHRRYKYLLLGRDIFYFAPEWTPGFQLDSCFFIFSFICMFCRWLFVLLSFFFWPLCSLFFFIYGFWFPLWYLQTLLSHLAWEVRYHLSAYKIIWCQRVNNSSQHFTTFVNYQNGLPKRFHFFSCNIINAYN